MSARPFPEHFERVSSGARMPTLWLLAAVVAAFLAFAAVFEIDEAVRAQGQVIPGLRTQVIQAVDGGVLVSLHVREGDSVKAGQILAELEPDRARAGEAQSRAEVAGKRLALLRARAEAAGTEPAFDREQASAWPRFVSAQRALYLQRRRSLDEELQAHARSLALAREELGMNERLFAAGDISRSEVMRAQRQVLDIEARITTARNKYLQESRTEVARLEEELSSSRYKHEERASVLQHTTLTAPTDGVVKLLRVSTVGGVLRPGDELMQISPSDDELLVEIKVNPADVGQLVTGLPASLRFDAFDSGIYGKVEGRLRYLSPDTLTETGAGGQQQVYYRAQVAIDWARTHEHEANRVRAQDIKPGMTATADVLTGQRSILTFLAKPVVKAFSGALIRR